MYILLYMCVHVYIYALICKCAGWSKKTPPVLIMVTLQLHVMCVHLVNVIIDARKHISYLYQLRKILGTISPGH